jgi:hypothetical protein
MQPGLLISAVNIPLLDIHARKQWLLLSLVLQLVLLVPLLVMLPCIQWEASILLYGCTLLWVEPDVVLQDEDDVKPNGHKAQAKLDRVACKHTACQGRCCNPTSQWRCMTGMHKP